VTTQRDKNDYVHQGVAPRY